MLTRRIFTALGAAFAITAACRPSWGARASAVDGTDTVSPRLSALADQWLAAGQEFDRCRHAAFYKDTPSGVRRGYLMDEPPLLALREATRAMYEAANAVFQERSRTRADVLLKYHIMDDAMNWRFGGNTDAIIAAGGATWHIIVDREAKAFGLDLNAFWLWEASPDATIDGDRNSPKWAAISRWRTEQYSRA
jgi:hypothetical protein